MDRLEIWEGEPTRPPGFPLPPEAWPLAARRAFKALPPVVLWFHPLPAPFGRIGVSHEGRGSLDHSGTSWLALNGRTIRERCVVRMLLIE